MANRRITTAYSNYAEVDSSPGADGYFTETVTPRRLKDSLFFSVRETSVGAAVDVVLQFQCRGDNSWQTYNNGDSTVFKPGDRVEIDDSGAAVRWRAGVLSGGYVSGSVIFGFDW
jgi:hypothetical protein